jgi:hypothetical protein
MKRSGIRGQPLGCSPDYIRATSSLRSHFVLQSRPLEIGTKMGCRLTQTGSLANSRSASVTSR